VNRAERLARYVGHAQKYGTDFIMETAAEELPWSELGDLSLRLQAVDPRFKVPRDLAGRMVTALSGTVDDARLREMSTLGTKAYSGVVSSIEWRAV
jgi:hypothetical protein